jgi:CheY-like chemotaxis protein
MEKRPESLAGLRILVVEDEIMVAMMVEDMLTDLGCIVEVVPTVETALSAIHDHPLDGVLLDMNLHGHMTGAVAEELVRRAIPFLVVTGYGGGNVDPPAINAAPRLQKPFREQDLGRRMKETFLALPGR